MEGTTVLEVLGKGAQDSFTIWILAACSVASVMVIASRLWYFFVAGRAVEPVAFTNQVANALAGKDEERARTLCDQVEAPVARVCKAVLAQRGRERALLEGAVARAVEREILAMERFIGVLGTIGNVAPYLGLFGTVLGVMHAFQHLGAAAAAGHTVVMRGIAEALIATAVGLFVAIVAVVAYNYFVRKVKRTAKELQLSGLEVVDVLVR